MKKQLEFAGLLQEGVMQGKAFKNMRKCLLESFKTNLCMRKMKPQEARQDQPLRQEQQFLGAGE